MKKTIMVLLLATFIAPSIAFASWWNPFSWFSNWTFKDKLSSGITTPQRTTPDVPPPSPTKTKATSNVLPATPTRQTPPASDLNITTPSQLPNAKVGQPYSATLNISGGSGSYSRTSTQAAFPIPGLGFTSSQGNPMYISGTPATIYENGIERTTSQTFTFTVNVHSGSQTTSKQFTLTVDPATPAQQKPTISSIKTVHGGPAKIGDSINLYGSNFDSNSSVIIDNGTYSANLTFSSASVVSFTVPPNVPLGTRMIQLNSKTNGVSNTVNLNITAPVAADPHPTITGISTATGATPRPGDMVDVFGTNFTSNAGISIDGWAEPYGNLAQFTSSTLLNFVIPSNLSTGSHTVEVYVPISGGGAKVSNAFKINVVSQ
jgi:hypothetical protein